ncbi:MAG: hypothetical protein LBR83_03750, partial [Clostridiales bacterium]|nr:hypothetical protein [Clostridiales bacterium]
MRKKFLFVVSVAILLIAGVWCVALAYAFNISAETDVIAADPSAPVIPAFGEVKDVAVLFGTEVDAGLFLSDSPANGGVTAAFKDSVVFGAPGKHSVTLTLTKEEMETAATAIIYVLNPARSVNYETGITARNIRPEDFISNFEILNGSAVTYKLALLTDLTPFALDETGRYDVSLSFDGALFDSALYLEDTTPPTVKMASLTVNTGQPVTPEDFIVSVWDTSPYTARFPEGAEPDVFTEGTRDVTIILEDIYGNAGTHTVSMKVLPNVAPPALFGVKDLTVLLGDSVKYRQGVSAADSFGNPVNFTVDSSAVDVYVPGVYEITYTAGDANGNTFAQSAAVRVVEITEEALGGLVNPVLESIITEGMTQTEKARKIFDWIRSHITYIPDAPKDSALEGAYRAMRNRSGDCYTFYAISEVMLTRAGIENMMVTRVGGGSNHYWNLINPDGGGWYHF